MIRAVIFDFDGTVVDNEGEWEKAFIAVLNKHKTLNSKPLNPELQESGWIHIPGIGVQTNWERLVADKNEAVKLTLETLSFYTKTGIDLKPREGVGGVVEKIKSLGIMTALATSSTWTVVEPELAQLEMYLGFDITTTGEEVLLPKPDPEIYLLTSQKLEIDPKDCLVIEDSAAGIQAGKAAGMSVIGLVTEYFGAEGADVKIENYDDLNEYLDTLCQT